MSNSPKTPLNSPPNNSNRQNSKESFINDTEEKDISSPPTKNNSISNKRSSTNSLLDFNTSSPTEYKQEQNKYLKDFMSSPSPSITRSNSKKNIETQTSRKNTYSEEEQNSEEGQNSDSIDQNKFNIIMLSIIDSIDEKTRDTLAEDWDISLDEIFELFNNIDNVQNNKYTNKKLKILVSQLFYSVIEREKLFKMFLSKKFDDLTLIKEFISELYKLEEKINSIKSDIMELYNINDEFLSSNDKFNNNYLNYRTEKLLKINNNGEFRASLLNTGFDERGIDIIDGIDDEIILMFNLKKLLLDIEKVVEVPIENIKVDLERRLKNKEDLRNKLKKEYKEVLLLLKDEDESLKNLLLKKITGTIKREIKRKETRIEDLKISKIKLLNDIKDIENEIKIEVYEIEKLDVKEDKNDTQIDDIINKIEYIISFKNNDILEISKIA